MPNSRSPKFKENLVQIFRNTDQKLKNRDLDNFENVPTF